MAKPIEHIDGGDPYCLRCEAFGMRPDQGASMLEARRRRRSGAEIVLCYVTIVC